MREVVKPGEWIENQWALARRDADNGRPALLVLDEVQKARGWNDTVKSLWDEDRRHGRALRVVLVASSALLLEKGAADSLAGRFFLDRCPHWSFDECREAFGWSLERWLYFGGYPGAAPIARDVLALQTVNKPALLRQLFGLAARLPAQVVAYNKMLGQLQNAGNTTTLAHYLRLLATAFLVSGLERHSGGEARTRGSSPKLILWNNALVTTMGTRDFAAVRAEPDPSLHSRRQILPSVAPGHDPRRGKSSRKVVLTPKSGAIQERRPRPLITANPVKNYITTS